jgi:hypothetical protein
MTTSLALPLTDEFAQANDVEKFFGQRFSDKIRLGFEKREQSPTGAPNALCDTNLFFGFFFDGTKNNYVKAEAGKNHSNVARLYDCYPGLSVPGVLPKSTDWQHNPSRYSHFFKVYVPGVSSPFPQVHDTGEGKDEALGAAAGALGERRIIWALVQAINNVHRYFFKAPLFFQKELTETAAMTRSFSMRLVSTVLLSGAVILAGCEKPTVDVNIHGVNYKDDAFSYVVADPARPDSAAGGELVDAFAAGGTTCCFTLPRVWKPGIKVQVHTIHWLEKRADGSLPEVKETHLVEVPHYVDGKPGELWIIRTPESEVNVVSSDFQPDHPQWPGKIKGWPVSSLEYQRQRWEILRDYEEGGVKLFTKMLDQIKREPLLRAKEDWNFSREHDPSALKNFSGPDDPAYLMFLRNDYEKGLERSKERLARVMEAKP